MDPFHRKRYRRYAAAEVREGRRSMSVDPQHLLELLVDVRPAPVPTELERRVEALQREVLSLRSNLATETARANRAYAEGHAAGILEQIEELRRVRAQLATSTVRKQIHM